MPIARDIETKLLAEGISLLHAESFLEVSKSTGCIIMTRTPGEACLGLLAEGHDAKGFHIKGKSCDWGPMAGFLCAEPLFNKAGGAGAIANAKAHHASLTKPLGKTGLTSRLVALELSEERAAWVARRLGVKLEGAVVQGTTPIPNTQLKLGWLLVHDVAFGRWQVYHDASGLAAATRLLARPDDLATVDAYRQRLDKQAGGSPSGFPGYPGYKPVLALTNPYAAYTQPETNFKNAVTGDFDLFAVWPRAGQDAPFRVRVGGMKNVDPKAQKAAIYAAEERDAIGQVVGNISDGLYDVGQRLNSVMAQKTGVSANRIFHSDEGGRPGMDTVDSSVAFTPDGRILFFNPDIPGFTRLALDSARAQPPDRFVVFLNAGWLAPMEKAAPADAAALKPLVAWQQSLADAPQAR